MKRTLKSKYYCVHCDIYYDVLDKFYRDYNNKLCCPECCHQVKIL